MAMSSFLRERAQAYTDHILAVLLLVGGSTLTGSLIAHYGPVLGLDPRAALVLAWVIALLVAVSLSLLLKPEQKPKESDTDHNPATEQRLSQSGIVNAPHFEFNPHIEVNPAFNQTQSQSHDQSQFVRQETPKLSFECIRAGLIDVEVDMNTFEISLSTGGNGLKCKAAVADFRRNTDNSKVDTISIRTIAELRGRDGESLSINEGRWLEHDDKNRRSATVPFGRLDTKRLAIVLGISNNKVYTYEGRYVKAARIGLSWIYEFKNELQELSEAVYDVEIWIAGSYGGSNIVDDHFGFELIRGAELKDSVFRKKNPCLLAPGVQPDKSELIKQLSSFADEGNELLRLGKAATEHLWPKAREWASRSEHYIRQKIGDDSAEWFSLATSEPWPGLAIDREFVNWVYRRVQRLGELASEVRKK